MRYRSRLTWIIVFATLPLWLLIIWVAGFSFYRQHFQVGLYHQWQTDFGMYDFQYVVNDTLYLLLQQIFPSEPKNIARVNLKISYDDHMKLVRQRGGLRSQYVRAALEHEGINYNVRTRNRGGHAWHYYYPKKSWRIKVLDQAEQATSAFSSDQFDLIAVKVYPPMDPFFDRWATLAGVKNFGSKLVSLNLNSTYNGIGLLAPALSEFFLEQRNLSSGSVLGVDPEVYEALPERQMISAAWEDGRKWLVLHESKSHSLDRSRLVELIDDLSLPSRQFTQKYRDKLDGFIRQLAYHSYVGIFHITATANVKVHVDGVTGMFEPLSWDYLWPAQLPELLYSGHPIFNKIIESPEMVALVVDRIVELIQGPLKPDLIQADLSQYLSEVDRLFKGDPNAMAISNLDVYYGVNIFFISRGLSQEKKRFYEISTKWTVAKRIQSVLSAIEHLSPEYRPWSKNGRSGIYFSCGSWQVCQVLGFRSHGRLLQATPDRNCNYTIDSGEARPDDGVKLLPAGRKTEELDPAYTKPVFPTREFIDYPLGHLIYPFVLNSPVTDDVEVLIRRKTDLQPRWIKAKLNRDLKNDYIGYHPWGHSCER